MEVTFLSKVRNSQCVQGGQMFHSFAQPEGFGLVHCGKRIEFEVGITGGAGERLLMPIL